VTNLGRSRRTLVQEAANATSFPPPRRHRAVHAEGQKGKAIALITCGSDAPVWGHRGNREGTGDRPILEFELPAVLERGQCFLFCGALTKRSQAPLNIPHELVPSSPFQSDYWKLV